MAGRSDEQDAVIPVALRPALSPEEREQQLTALAYDLAEEQIRNKTASSQVISHFLKAGSTTEAVNREKTRKDIEMADAKIDQMKQGDLMMELMERAINAMRSYGTSDSRPEELMTVADDFQPQLEA